MTYAPMIAFLKNIGTLTLLLIAFPINCTIVFISLLISWVTSPFHRRINVKNPKNILITGGKMTKALQLARSFHQAGHQVFFG